MMVTIMKTKYKLNKGSFSDILDMKIKREEQGTNKALEGREEK